MDFWIIISIFFLEATCGIWIGKCIADRNWRKNADVPYRIFSNGSLYKVHYDN